MTNETRHRIHYFENKLPHMRGQVMAALFALVIAAITAATATYAWVTLSQAPAVSGIATTLSANGSLEIALAKSDGSEPDDADIDESVIISTDVTVTNLQWGNLINISDQSYGIDDLVLRPAELNAAAINTNPLNGAVYGADGRISDTTDQFTYATWDADSEQFTASQKKGVRAISSYRTEEVTTNTELESRKTSLDNAHTKYAVKTNNDDEDDDDETEYKGTQYLYTQLEESIPNLNGIISTYLQAKVNGRYVSQIKGYLGNGEGDNLEITRVDLNFLIKSFEYLVAAMDNEKDTLVQLANIQQYLYAQENGLTDADWSEVTWDDLVQNKEKYDASGTAHKSNAATPDESISLTGLKSFISDYNTAMTDLGNEDDSWKNSDGNELTGTLSLYALRAKSKAGYTITTEDAQTQVNHICNVETCKILIDGEYYKVSTLLSSLTTYMGQLDDLCRSTDTTEIVITEGLIKNFEQMAIDSSSRLTYGKNGVSVYAEVYETLGYYVDLTAYLTTDANTVSYYSKDEAKVKEAIENVSGVTKITEDTYGMVVDFWIRSNAESTYLTLEGATTTDTDGTILSYDGVNRVWGKTGNTALTTDSTTQGSGSCYTFYADSPEEQTRSLVLLKNMKVAFISSDGDLLATASMDTDNSYAVNGRVVVPLVLDIKNSMSYTIKGENDIETTGYAIKRLSLDESTMISAVIYLDGTSLENTDVLAIGDIQGQLNLQFGTSDSLLTIGDNSLLNATRSVTANLHTEAEGDQIELTYEYDTTIQGSGKQVGVVVKVDGAEPSTMTAFFIRAINSTQGTRQGTMQFERDDATGKWQATYTFMTPGDYYLRYIRMDGVDYVLETPLYVKIDGFALESVSWGEGDSSVTYYTTNSSYPESVTIRFATTDASLMPTTVQAQFVRQQDGAVVNINTTRNGDKWEGTGTFSASGTYVLSCLIADGDKIIDASSFTKTLILHLGMSAEIYGDNVQTDYVAGKTYDQEVQVIIKDNGGNVLKDLQNVILYYSNGGSASNTIDTNLTWDSAKQRYLGKLPISAAGRYVFSRITVNGNSVTRATQSPTYTIIPPDAPEYVKSSSVFNGNNIQYVPLNMNGTIGPIKIENSSAASMSAVVYNSVTKKYYDISMTTDTTEKSAMYYDSGADGGWIINLPTYRLDEDDENSALSQDGTWSLVALKLWNCYDSAGKMHADEDTALTWLAKDSAEANDYAAENEISANDNLDFSALSTTVSSTINVSTESDTTAFGSETAAFMSQYNIKDLGTTITIADDYNNPIPSSSGAFSFIDSVTMTVKYNGNSNTSYGYEVSSSAIYTYNVPMKLNSDNVWVPDSEKIDAMTNANKIWQYVGEYRVTGIEVKLSGITYHFDAKNSDGSDIIYTVTSAAPTASDITVDSSSIVEGNTTFGKDANGNVTGAFLEAYSKTVTVPLKWTTVSVDDNKQYAMVPDLTLTVNYAYQDGTTAPNGGYSWTGTTGYETLKATSSSATNDGRNYKVSAVLTSTPLLAGTYSVSYELTDAGNQSIASGSLTDIEVYSVSPKIEITGVSPSPTKSVNVNPAGGTASVSTSATFAATNSYSNDFAVVYIAYTTCTSANNTGTWGDYTSTNYTEQYAYYTLPKISFKASNVGKAFTFDVGNTEEVTVDADGSKTIEVGYITKGTATHYEVYETANGAFGSNKSANFTYATYTPHAVGTRNIETVTTTYNGVTYTRALANSIYLREENTEMAGYDVTCAAITGATVSGLPTGNKAQLNQTVTLTITATEGYHAPRLTEPDGVSDWTVISEGETESQYSFVVRFSNVSLSGSATAYPTLSWSNGTNMTISKVTVDGVEQSSGVKVQPGSVISVTATPNTGYYDAKVTTHTGVDSWTSSKEGDFESTYTFTMPDGAVTLQGNTASQMYHIYWTNGDVTFTATYSPNGTSIAQNGYAIPGRKIRIAMGVSGGKNPQLISPEGAENVPSSSSAFLSYYDFEMPSEDVTLEGTLSPYDKVTFAGSDYAAFSVKDAGFDVTIGDDGTLGVAPDNLVTVTLTAKAGYYAPRLTSSDVTFVSKEENDDTSTYTFSMPDKAVTVTASATEAPTVKLTNSKATLTLSGTNYDGSAIGTGTEIKVQPGQTVTVKATYKSGYYAPTVTTSDVDLSERKAGDDNGWDTATYTFTMGKDNVTLTGEGTDDPTVSVNLNNVLKSAKVNGTSNSNKVHPGKTATIVVTAADDYYNPAFTGVTATETSGDYETATYTFTMSASNVSLTGSATANPTVTLGSNAMISGTTVNGSNALGTTVKVRPGTTATVVVTAADDYYNPTATAASDSGVALSKQNSGSDYGKTTYTFTMGTLNVTLTGSATKNPTVIFTKGSNISSFSSSIESGDQVRPGTTVTFSVTASHSGRVVWTYYTPSCTVNSGGVALTTTSTSGGEYWTNKTYNYSFTMGTKDVKITYTAS